MLCGGAHDERANSATIDSTLPGAPFNLDPTLKWADRWCRSGILCAEIHLVPRRLQCLFRLLRLGTQLHVMHAEYAAEESVVPNLPPVSLRK